MGYRLGLAPKVGERIRSRRQDPALPGGPLTQEGLAAAVKVTQPVVSDWEAGKSLPSVERLLLLAKVFGCDVDDLIGDIEPASAAS